jgi:hypothetical protein
LSAPVLMFLSSAALWSHEHVRPHGYADACYDGTYVCSVDFTRNYTACTISNPRYRERYGPTLYTPTETTIPTRYTKPSTVVPAVPGCSRIAFLHRHARTPMR